jgi:hypothetical protein
MVELLQLAILLAAACPSSAATQIVRIRKDAGDGILDQTLSGRAACLARGKPRSGPDSFEIILSASLRCNESSTCYKMLASQSD